MRRAKLDEIKIKVIDEYYLLIVISEAEEVLNKKMLYKDSQAYTGGSIREKTNN
ncbi:hypothetical protein [Clostridium sp. UBA6640]|uniref:hypothetical protein n=1 Tax=Clostridium sp. UBA6640 TaxID=1946370 RepID=UPI0025B8D896|nr:hypothetical protein [Clostridium sp. UBA6640]